MCVHMYMYSIFSFTEGGNERERETERDIKNTKKKNKERTRESERLTHGAEERLAEGQRDHEGLKLGRIRLPRVYMSAQHGMPRQPESRQAI